MNTATIGAHFAAQRSQYHHHAQHQRLLAERLAAKTVVYITAPCTQVLEIGCGTGFLTEALTRQWRLPLVQDYWLNDLYTVDDLNPPAQQVQTLVGDIASVALPVQLDLVLSSSALQWVTDLPAVLTRLRAVMGDDALIAVSLYCGAHFHELKHTLDIGLDYHTADDLSALFGQHFHCLVQETISEQRFFPDGRAVLAHIRQTGVATLREQTTFTALRHYPTRYEKLKQAQGYPLTYQAWQFIGRVQR